MGEDCKIEINRNRFATNPKDFIKKPPDAAEAQSWEGAGWIAQPHDQKWLDCIKTREKPNADVEIGHRSISACHLANIAREVGHKLKWGPEAEKFLGNEKTNTCLARPRRQGYESPKLI